MKFSPTWGGMEREGAPHQSMQVVAYELPRDKHLIKMDPQAHTRGFAYVISDRLTRRHVVLTHGLSRAHQYLAKVCEDDPPCMASLYEAATARNVHTEA